MITKPALLKVNTAATANVWLFSFMSPQGGMHS